MANIFKAGAAKFRAFAKTTTLKTKKHAPEILVVAGIVATGAAIVTACKATRKLDKIIDEHKADMEKINDLEKKKDLEFVDDDGTKQKYTKDTAKMDKFCTYRDTAFKLVKNYAIPAGLFIVGMTCFVASTVILKKREKAALALFNGSLAAFNAYRSRVRDAVGDEVEDRLYHGIDEVKVTKLKDDGTTEEKNVKILNSHNVYTFTMNNQTCRFWEKDMRYNLMLARSVEQDINDLVFGPYGGEPVELNVVLKKLGMLKCGAMMGEGWVPEKLGGKVTHVSFGLDKYTLPDEEGGLDITNCDEIVLEFNCEHIMDKF